MKIKRILIDKVALAWTLIAAIVGLMFLRDVHGFSLNKFFFIGLAGLAMLIADKYVIYELIAFLIPLFAGLPGNYIACMALILVIVKSNFKLTIDLIGLITIAIILAIELLSIVRGYDFSIIEYITFSGAFLLTFLFVFDRDKQYDYWKIARNFSFGLLFAIIILIGEMLRYYSLSELLSLGVRIGSISEITGQEVDSMTLSYNSNGLGVFCAACIMMCLISCVKFRKKWTIPLGCIFLLTGLMTQSRTFAVTLFLGLIMFIFTGNDKPSAIIKKLIVFIIGFALAVFLIFKFMPNYFESFIGRFRVADISNGRNDITSQYWEKFLNSIDKIPLGSGLQNYAKKYNIYTAAHLGFLEVLVTWGLVGLICVIIMFVRAVVSLEYRRFSEYDMLIPFAVIIIGLQAGQFFSNTTAFMSLLAWMAFAKIPGTIKKP